MRTFMISTLLLGMSMTMPAQTLQVFELFTDHAVLQRETEVPIWGWGLAGTVITISLDGQETRNIYVNPDGKWQYKLSPQVAGGPHLIDIRSGGDHIQLKDIYFGDVWLCSGQSNMEWSIGQSAMKDSSLQDIADPMIRQYYVAHTFSNEEQERLAAAKWEEGTAEQIRDFTAVGTYFAHYVREKNQDVPIGLVHSSWGGSRIEPWMSASTLGFASAAEANKESDEAEKAMLARSAQELQAKFGHAPTEDKGLDLGWHQAGFDDSQWPVTNLPALWKEQGFTAIDGSFWYRYSFELTAEEAKNSIKIGLAKIDDGDYTYLNGQLVGSRPLAWNEERHYPIAPQHLKAGTNVLAIRVVDNYGAGGFHGDAASMYLETSKGRRSITDGWRYQVGAYYIASKANQNPIVLYNKMIYPMQQFPLKGVLWYQGESNAEPKDAYVYRDHFKSLIQSWRQQWKQADLPFYFVQLANFMPPAADPNTESSWAVLRESQTSALELPHTHQAVIIDIGEEEDIHPRNKRDVGYRLALAARAEVYGEDKLPYASPRFHKMERSANQLIVHFQDVGGGLQVKDKAAIKGFAIAGEDGVFHWAKARLNGGQKIELSHEAVPAPVAVRYAWADNPDEANVYSEDGLPLTPFRAKLE